MFGDPYKEAPMRKAFGIFGVFFVLLVCPGTSQTCASELSKPELENLVSEIASLKARVTTLEQDLRNVQNKTEEDKQQLVYTMANLWTLKEVVESIRPSAEISIPRVMLNKESKLFSRFSRTINSKFS